MKITTRRRQCAPCSRLKTIP